MENALGNVGGGVTAARALDPARLWFWSVRYLDDQEARAASSSTPGKRSKRMGYGGRPPAKPAINAAA